jgi:polar amino acid transport system substrate-binding protein
VSAAAPAADAAVLRDLAPTGVVRAALNFGNSVLAQRDPNGGPPQGVSVALAEELARRLGVAVTFVPFDAAVQVFDALKANAWDVAFLANDPKRAGEILFSPPYLLIEGAYLVRVDSPITELSQVDAPGMRIATGAGSAYDLFLARTLKHARIERQTTGRAALEHFLAHRPDALAGIRQVVERHAAEQSGLRVLPGSFMVIEQAIGTPRPREAGARYLAGFIEEMKASGRVAEALRQSGQADARVAPPHAA